MIKKDIALIVSDRTDLNNTKTLRAVDAVLNSIKDSLTAGEIITLRGFGTFQAKFRTARKARNPKTGTEAMIAEGRSVRFKPKQEDDRGGEQRS